jgi:hypothetical protein
MVATMAAKFTEAELEWDPETGKCVWDIDEINDGTLKEWVTDPIAFKTPGGQIPFSLNRLPKYPEITTEQKQIIMQRYFRELDGVKDYAKRWWTLVRKKELPMKDLAEELERMRKTLKNQRELKIAIRSMAGRKHAKLEPEPEQKEGRDPEEIVATGEVLRIVGTAHMES